MKDDSLSDTQQLNVGKCDCDIGMCAHIANCRLNLLRIAEVEMSKAVAEYPNNVYARNIWNEAIEAAALLIAKVETNLAEEIRKLKK